MQHLQTALQQNAISLTDQQTQQLLTYLELIQRWNKVFNLTAITDFNDMIQLHLIDSLIINPYLTGQRFLDVGTGAGLPGIPLAIMNPEQQWFLLDKSSKKTRFLTQVIAELELKQVKVINSRCEDFQPEQCFDTILSRAFATLDLFTTTTQHLLCNGGQWLAMKGKLPQDEINALPSIFHVEEIIPLHMKGKTIERHLIRITRIPS